MSDAGDEPLNAAHAVTAAGAALWTFHQSPEASIAVRAEPGGPLARLDGVWRLAELLGEFDGLARPLVSSQLRDGRTGDAVNVRVMLAEGLQAHIVGAFHDDGHARGLIVCADPQSLKTPESEVTPVFQAIRRSADLSVAGFEALARFRDGSGRLVGPDALGRLGGAGDWKAIAPAMMRRSAQQLRALRDDGRDVFMQVNLSAAEIGDPVLVEEIAELVRTTGLPPGALRVELTEQAALRDFEGALGALAAIRAAGAGVVLDDFGGGHSSFAWLAELPAEGVKLDPKLVDISARPRAAILISGLSSLVRSLGMSVTAEGVERPGDLSRLRDMGCEFVQGFAFDLPLEADQIERAFAPVA
jgi:EAL domain-containing protein (putative c-di-GMP-specific phosphodiesterase class I)